MAIVKLGSFEKKKILRQANIIIDLNLGDPE